MNDARQLDAMKTGLFPSPLTASATMIMKTRQEGEDDGALSASGWILLDREFKRNQDSGVCVGTRPSRLHRTDAIGQGRQDRRRASQPTKQARATIPSSN